MTEFCVLVLRKPVEHRVRFKKVQEWVQSTTKGGPAGIVLREVAEGIGGSIAQG